MTINNADKSAMPSQSLGTDGLPTHEAEFGLTKRETFCLHMGVAETGDAELDAIIRNGNRQKMATQMMEACRSRNSEYWSWEDMAKDAIEMTDALLAELERTSANK